MQLEVQGWFFSKKNLGSDIEKIWRRRKVKKGRFKIKQKGWEKNTIEQQQEKPTELVAPIHKNNQGHEDRLI